MAIKPVVQVLNDKSLMPFGQKYRGIPMEKVPASYYHWLWHNIKTGNCDLQAVRDYISNTMSALQEENADLIWDDTE